MHALLALMRERGVEAVAVEVSAQALSRHRVDGIVFDVAGLHEPQPRPPRRLRRHAASTSRRSCRCSAPTARVAPSSASTPPRAPRSSRAARCPSSPSAPPTIAATPRPPPRADWVVEILDERAGRHRVHASPAPDGRSLTTIVPVIGRHMAANAALAIVMLLEARLRVGAHRRRARRRPHRRATCPVAPSASPATAGPAVYVDFGHSPDAFEKTLAAVRRVTPGKVLMLFGADGDRDATKRHDMGRTARRGQRHPRRHRPPPALRGPRHDPGDPHRGRAPRAARRRDPRVLAARARDHRGRRARRRRRRHPVGRARPPGLPRHPRRAHARTRRASWRAARCAPRAGPCRTRTGPCPTPTTRRRSSDAARPVLISLGGSALRSRGPRHPRAQRLGLGERLDA